MAVTTQATTGSLDGDSVLHLLVSAPDVHSTIRLPEAGQLVIGRDDKAQVRILDPRASRRHALLHLGRAIEIEDLGSANGTCLGSQRLPANERIPLPVGQALLIGDTTLVLQYQWVALRTRSHGHFYDRLAEECARCEGVDGATFAVLRIHVVAEAAPDTVVDAIIRSVRPGDLLAVYADCEYELLLPDSGLATCEELAARVGEALSQLSAGPRIGLACFPRDGASPGALLARACAGTRGRELEVEGAVVNHPTTRALYAKVAQVAKSNANVLILGETGVGKEEVARSLHRQSLRASGPFLAINCTAFGETTLEDQLFGHERGAYSGADRARPGLLEAAHGGTLFLDEVGDMPLGMQAKLLRAVECGEIIRLGSTRVQKVDVRFVAATNHELGNERKEKGFREDFYQRLAVIVLRMPPLRERKEEIEPLARHFLASMSKAIGCRTPELSPAAMKILLDYSWPGNVRELKNTMEHALALCRADTITPEHLPVERISMAATATPAQAARADLASGHIPDDRSIILDALARCGGSQKRAADILGISRYALMRRLDELGIERPRANQPPK